MKLENVLWPAQLRVARLVAAGHSNQSIADQLGRSVHTITSTLTASFDAVGLPRDGKTNRRVLLALMVLEQGLIEQPRVGLGGSALGEPVSGGVALP